ncbi:hypothetical protein WJR50_29805 [Catalinimonas sp. 4WD22]|uniref:hypothetical protein n=1 Tax=Catalinimonas locisalis TaxID=3133978 RepID=UPI003100E683
MRNCLVVILCLCAVYVHAQEKEKEKKYTPRSIVDTIHIEKNTLVVGEDSIFFLEKDSVLYIQDSVKSEIESLLQEGESTHEKEFYENLTKDKDSSLLREKIIDLVIDSEDESDSSSSETQVINPDPSFDLEGKVVGNITIQGIEVFGPSVNDTTYDKTSSISRFINKLHMYTCENVIRNRLLLEKGDYLNAAKLLDNERLIRSLPYIRDARFMVETVRGDTVDLRLVTQDLVAYTVSASPDGLDGGDFSLNNLNILGYGHQMYNTIKIDRDRSRKFGYEGEYLIPNIRGTLIEGLAIYENTIYRQRYNVSAERSFLTPGIKFAGGVSLDYSRELAYAPWINDYDILHTYEHEEDIPRHLFKRFTQDYWIGKSFSPGFITAADPRARLVVALRYQQKNFFDRPEVSIDTNRAFHNRHLLLMSLGYSRNNFTRERLVYGYGRTEDIPLGKVTEIIFGPEKGEFYNRFFTGIRVARGNYVRPLGYISGGFRLGGYWHNRELEDGLLQVAARTFSYPIQWKRTSYRLFFNVDYALGISQNGKEDFRENMISLNDRQGIRGMRSYRMHGNKRLALSLETVAYLPFEFYSFRMATFFFADAGLIANHDEKLLDSPLYQGYGLGLRVRNERLAYKTFQLRFACYPVAPLGESQFKVTIAGLPIPRLMDFSVRKPQAFEFE